MLLSLSRTIQKRQADYYDALKRAQRTNHITAWIEWFVRISLEAQIDAERLIEFTLRKTRFLERLTTQVNDRQRKALHRMHRMLEAGPDRFAGVMSAAKHISLTRTSRATATRDLQALAAMSLLAPIGAGRSSRYELVLG